MKKKENMFFLNITLRNFELDLIFWTCLCDSVYMLCERLDIEIFMTKISGKINDYDSCDTITGDTITTNHARHTRKLP